LLQFKKFPPSVNLKFDYSGIFQSFNLRILMVKTLLISFKTNFILNTLGCFGLKILEEDAHKLKRKITTVK